MIALITIITLMLCVSLIVAIVDRAQTSAYARETAVLVARKQELITHVPDMTIQARS